MAENSTIQSQEQEVEILSHVDEYLKKNIHKNHIFSLLPASIISNSNKNFYLKLKKFMQKKMIKIIFYLFCPGGQFNFCYSSDIAKEIINIIKSEPEYTAQDMFSRKHLVLPSSSGILYWSNTFQINRKVDLVGCYFLTYA